MTFVSFRCLEPATLDPVAECSGFHGKALGGLLDRQKISLANLDGWQGRSMSHDGDTGHLLGKCDEAEAVLLAQAVPDRSDAIKRDWLGCPSLGTALYIVRR